MMISIRAWMYLSILSLMSCGWWDSSHAGGTTDETETGQKLVIAGSLGAHSLWSTMEIILAYPDSSGNLIFQDTTWPDANGNFAFSPQDSFAYTLLIRNRYHPTQIYFQSQVTNSQPIEPSVFSEISQFQPLYGQLWNSLGLRYANASCGIQGTQIQDTTQSNGVLQILGSSTTTQAWCTSGTDTIWIPLLNDSTKLQAYAPQFLAQSSMDQGPFLVEYDSLVTYDNSIPATSSLTYPSSTILFQMPSKTDEALLPVQKVILSKEPLTNASVQIWIEGSDSLFSFPAGLWGGTLSCNDVDGDGKIMLLAQSASAFSISFDWVP